MVNCTTAHSKPMRTRI
nr:unnamed protein product [Callosobruchus chinensis]